MSTAETPERPPGWQHKNVQAAKLAVMAEVAYVAKAWIEAVKYSAAQERAIIAAIRPAMVAHGLTVHPAETTLIRSDKFATKNGAEWDRVVVGIRYVLHHAASGTEEIIHVLGEGSCNSDKAVPKSMTIGYKYLFRQAFCLETGDDPDEQKPEAVARRTHKGPPTKPPPKRPVFDQIWADLAALYAIAPPKPEELKAWMADVRRAPITAEQLVKVEAEVERREKPLRSTSVPPAAEVKAADPPQVVAASPAAKIDVAANPPAEAPSKPQEATRVEPPPPAGEPPSDVEVTLAGLKNAAFVEMAKTICETCTPKQAAEVLELADHANQNFYLEDKEFAEVRRLVEAVQSGRRPAAKPAAEPKKEPAKSTKQPTEADLHVKFDKLLEDALNPLSFSGLEMCLRRVNERVYADPPTLSVAGAKRLLTNLGTAIKRVLGTGEADLTEFTPLQAAVANSLKRLHAK